MLDDFFVRALLAGAGMALIAGPLGCLVVWRRLAYFGDTLSHAALLGVALGLLLQASLTLAVLAVCVAVALALLFLQRRANLSSDALLGLLSHASLAIGMVVLALMSWVRIDLMGLLFGDILAGYFSPLHFLGDVADGVDDFAARDSIVCANLFQNQPTVEFFGAIELEYHEEADVAVAATHAVNRGISLYSI